MMEIDFEMLMEKDTLEMELLEKAEKRRESK